MPDFPPPHGRDEPLDPDVVQPRAPRDVEALQPAEGGEARDSVEPREAGAQDAPDVGHVPQAAVDALPPQVATA